jgi:RNA polymerase sigma-B factor
MGVDARSRVIEGHLPLVRSVAGRYVGSGESLDDLVQVGTIGLIKAVDRFDPGRDRDLAALARPSIEGEIRHHLRDRVGAVRVPRPEHELASQLRAAAADLTARHHRVPTAAELASAVGVDEARAARALHAVDAARPLPLDDADAHAPSSAAGLEAAEARALLDRGWRILDERERRMLELRFREDRSQAEIARELGLSQAHVSRLLRLALERLRTEVGTDAPARPAQRRNADGDGDRAAGRPASSRSGRLLLRLPQTLHTEVAAAAEREGVPLNTFIAGTLAGAVGWQDPAEPPAGRRRRAGRRGPTTLLIVNIVVIALAAVAGMALLLAALLGG